MNVFCIGRNYLEHIEELHNQMPSDPVIFMKPESALQVGTQLHFELPDFSSEIHHEVEVVIRLKGGGRNLSDREAIKLIDGVGLGIDFTARDLQSSLKDKGHPWEIAKGFRQSAAVSPMLPLSEVLTFPALSFRLDKNQEPVQEGHTADMIFSFERIINHLSRYFKLQKGDLIFTGTPAGVGPVATGDVLEAWLDEEPLLTVEVD